jgi:predicted nucleotidyltransferase
MAALTERERECLLRFCALLAERLGVGLVEVRMFGSAARGDMWAAHSPMHSDVDVLVVTREAVSEEQQEALLDATYPLYLECGRQISPHFFSLGRLAEPENERTRVFLDGIGRDAVRVWPPEGGGAVASE